MNPQVRARLQPVLFVFLALLGTWVGHGIEYARVGGVDGVAAGLAGPLHGYMLPAGAALLVLTLLFGAEVVALVRRSRRRAEQFRSQLAAVLRGHRAQVVVARPRPRTPGAALHLFAGMAAAQVLLYLLQENLEAAAAGVPAPGLAAITGIHWAAPLVHVSVATLLGIVVLLARRLWQRDLQLLSRQEALLVMLTRRQRSTSIPRRPALRLPTVAWLAAACWGRSPPLRAPA